MSLAEAAEVLQRPAAPLSEVTPGATQRSPLPRRRLDLIYFALAGIDLLTITFTLMLSNHIMTMYEHSVAGSAAWSQRVSEVVELAQQAQRTNAPGNDVFDTHNASAERQRRDTAL